MKTSNQDAKPTAKTIIYRGDSLVIDTSCRYSANDQVVIEATDESGEPYAVMSVCLAHESVKPGHTFIDTNNLPDALEILVSNNLVESTGKIGRSGYCEYPEVRVL